MKLEGGRAGLLAVLGLARLRRRRLMVQCISGLGQVRKPGGISGFVGIANVNEKGHFLGVLETGVQN